MSRVEQLEQKERTVTPAAPLGTDASNGRFSDIIIAVHGIGAQHRNTTVRSVANRLAQSRSLLDGSDIEPLAPQPLGYFHGSPESAGKVVPLDHFPPNSTVKLAGVGFTEVFWADIPQKVVDEGRTIEETKAWARTVVARAQALCARAQKDDATIVPPDFTLAAEVLNEIIDTVYVLQNLAWIGEKAGVLKFDLREVLDEYLGDVQIVTEFESFRHEIVGRFSQAMQAVYQNNKTARLHIVAHSEGTVVSFLGLLDALAHRDLSSTWVRHVAGYMTMGSPIDKHLLLWPTLFKPYEEGQLLPANEDFRDNRIQWHNYYDYGDPVGFNLDTARLWLKKQKCEVFHFTEHDDHGFARYLFPGKAHNDYWADPAVFDHFVETVVAPSKEIDGAARPPTDSPAPKIPADRPITGFLSPLFPYLLSFLLLFAGTVLLYHAVSRFTNPRADSVQSFIRMTVVGDFPAAAPGAGELAQHALGVALLVAGVTLLARWPRIVKGRRWWIAGATAFQLGCVGFVALVPKASRHEIGKVFEAFPILLTSLTMILSVAVGFVVLSLALAYAEETKQKMLRGQRRNLGNWVFTALAITVGLVLAVQFFDLGPMERILSPRHTAFFVTYGLLVTALTMPWWKHGKKKPKQQKSPVRTGIVTSALVAFGLGSVLYSFGPATLRAPIEEFFAGWSEPATAGILAMALLAALIGMMALVKPMTRPPQAGKGAKQRIKALASKVAVGCNLNASRRTRWFSKRMRPLIFSGAAGIAGLVVFQMITAPDPLSDEQGQSIREKYILWRSNEVARLNPQALVDPSRFDAEATARVSSIENMVDVRPPIWPVAIAGAAFLYLWWLAALIFDLGFVWQYYVRRSVANERLFQWCRNRLE